MSLAPYTLVKAPGAPLYESLYEAVKGDILSGKLAAGARLESKRSLALDLGVSLTTVERAYDQLVSEGWVHGERGRGFFVNELEGAGPAERASRQASQAGQTSPACVPAEPGEPDWLIDFRANQAASSQFPFSTWTKLMRRVAASHDPALTSTVPYNGALALRRAIASHLAKFRGMAVSPAQIVVGAGTEYLYSRLLQLLGADSVYATEDPGYKRFADISSQFGILQDYIPIDEAGIRMDRLRQSRANIAQVSPANHFPTGTVMPVSRRMELLSWANEDTARYVIEDDYDSEFYYGGRSAPTLYELDPGRRVIYLNTFSKSLVPSLRISYLVLPPQLVDRYRATMSFYSCTVSSFEQLTLAAFIEGGYFERHIRRLRRHYRERRDSVIEAFRNSHLATIAQVRVPDAGTHFLVRVKTRLSDDQIRERAASRRVHLALLSDYQSSYSLRAERTLVVNYASLDDDERIELALSVLEDIFREDIQRAVSSLLASTDL